VTGTDVSTTAAPHPSSNSASALSYPTFRAFAIGAMVSSAGTWMQNLTVPYVLYRQTHSATWVAMAAVANSVPGLFVAPVGGALADRHQRRWVLLYTQTILAILALGLWGAWTFHMRSPTMLVLLVACFGVMNGLVSPSWQSYLIELVPREAYLSAVSVNSAQFNIARALGPALAALVLATGGPSWTFACNALSFVAVLLPLAMMRVPRREIDTTDAPGVVRAYGQGVKVLWADDAMRTCFLIALASAGLVMPMLNLAAVVVGREYHAGAWGLGLLTAAYGMGSMTGWLLVELAPSARYLARSVKVRAGLFVCALSVLGFAASPGLLTAFPPLFIGGVAFLFQHTSCVSCVQLRVPEEYRGRVMGFYFLSWSAGLPLATLLMGRMSDLVNVRLTVATAGTLVLIVSLVLLVRPSITAPLD
jgi:MFS family permease